MIYHPKAIIDLGTMRGEELQAESQRYRHAAQAVALHRCQTQPVMRVRTGFISYLIALRTRMRDLIGPETFRAIMEPGTATRGGTHNSRNSLLIR